MAILEDQNPDKNHSAASGSGKPGLAPGDDHLAEVLVEFSMTPLDKGPSVSRYVARSLDIVAASGLDYRLGPMGTTIEGTWEECFSVIQACFEAMRSDCERISTSIKVDYRKGRQGRLDSKIDSVRKKVSHPIRT